MCLCQQASLAQQRKVRLLIAHFKRNLEALLYQLALLQILAFHSRYSMIQMATVDGVGTLGQTVSPPVLLKLIKALVHEIGRAHV